MTSLDGAGRPVCQVVGCQEAARPWGHVFDGPELELEVYLCPRHESAMKDVILADPLEEAVR